MVGQVGIVAALIAGVVSFLSPCVLPLIPGYLSFITGMSTTELAEKNRPLGTVLIPALLFVLGFTIVFVAFGASASVLGTFLSAYRSVVEKVAGLLVIAFGVLMLGIIKVPWLYGEARFDLEKSRSFGRGASLVMGMAFAAGWSPCVGPVLGSILALAGSSGSVGRGALLLLVYSAGLGVPFIAVALVFGRIRGLLRWLTRHSLVINRISGSIMIAIGVLIFFGRLEALATWMQRLLPPIA